MDAILLLEYALHRSKFNFHFKILLIRLYIQLGVCNRAWEIYQTMDVKQIQHDTLSYATHSFNDWYRYLFCDDVAQLGFPQTAFECLMSSKTIYRSNQLETPEMLVQAFRFGTFSKIPEFIRFYSRLHNSVQQVIGTFQYISNEMVHSSNTWEETCHILDAVEPRFLEAADYSKILALSDNRDWKVIPHWDNTSKNVMDLIHDHDSSQAQVCLPRYLTHRLTGHASTR